MHNEFDFNKGFTKGFKIFDKQDIGYWSSLGLPDPEPPTPAPPNGTSLICGNSYFNNDRVVSIYYNGVDLCATPPGEIATPETSTLRPNIIGRLILRIDTRLNSRIGSNTPYSSGSSTRSFELEFSVSSTFDVNWGSSNVVGGSQNESNSYTNANTASITYVNAGIYEVTVSARGSFDLQYPDIGGFGNCLLSITYPDDKFAAGSPGVLNSSLNLDRNFLGCINLVSADFPARDELNRPWGKDRIRSIRNTFQGCTSLTNVGFFTTNKIGFWDSAFSGCTSLQTVPNFDYSSVIRFEKVFQNSGLVKFDSAVPFGANARTFKDCWKDCSNLRDFAPGQFDNLERVDFFSFTGTFQGCALTAASIENILVSLVKTNGTNVFLMINGGTNAAKSTWTSNAITAYNTLVSRGWTITFNP